MPRHPYIRAFMAGVLLPTAVVFAVGILVAFLYFRIPKQTTQAMVLPMALNPCLWGLWNMLYRALGKSTLPIG
jgi:hypothetical protein